MPYTSWTDCFSEVSTCVFGEKLWEQVEEQLSFCETREIPWKNLVVMTDATAQTEELAAEITRKLEKQKKEKKRKQRQEKEKLSLIAPASSENSSSTQRSMRKQAKDLKKRKSKSPELLRRIEWKTYLSLSPNRRNRNLFPRGAG